MFGAAGRSMVGQSQTETHRLPRGFAVGAASPRVRKILERHEVFSDCRLKSIRSWDDVGSFSSSKWTARSMRSTEDLASPSSRRGITSLPTIRGASNTQPSTISTTSGSTKEWLRRFRQRQQKHSRHRLLSHGHNGGGDQDEDDAMSAITLPAFHRSPPSTGGLSACLRPPSAIRRAKEAHAVKQLMVRQRMLQMEHEKHQRVLTLVNRNEERKAWAVRLIIRQRAQMKWLTVLRIITFALRHMMSVEKLLSHYNKKKMLQRARSVVRRTLKSCAVAFHWQAMKLFHFKTERSRWRLIVFLRSFRKRYASKKLVRWLAEARKVKIQKRAQRVIKRLFFNVRKAQRQIRTLLACNRARLMMMRRLWDNCEADFLEELRAHFDKLKEMSPLSMRQHAYGLRVVVDGINRHIMRWVETDLRTRQLLEKEQNLGRISMAMKGYGEPPRIAPARRDLVLTQLLRKKRKLHIAEVKEAILRNQRSVKAKTGFTTQDAYKLLFSGVASSSRPPSVQREENTLTAMPCFVFYSSSPGQGNLEQAVRRLYYVELRRLIYGDDAGRPVRDHLTTHHQQTVMMVDGTRRKGQSVGRAAARAMAEEVVMKMQRGFLSPVYSSGDDSVSPGSTLRELQDSDVMLGAGPSVADSVS